MMFKRSQAAQVKSPALWNVVKVALINSIRTGVFFDRKYWARHTNAKGILKPIYFSSTIMNDTLWQLENRMQESLGWHVGTLNVHSGKIPHRSERSHGWS